MDVRASGICPFWWYKQTHPRPNNYCNDNLANGTKQLGCSVEQQWTCSSKVGETLQAQLETTPNGVRKHSL
jgi:hypothetical protein